MELIDNIKKTLKSDLITELHNGSKVSIAASCFSIYAFAKAFHMKAFVLQLQISILGKIIHIPLSDENNYEYSINYLI